jgi:hypothetical protein
MAYRTSTLTSNNSLLQREDAFALTETFRKNTLSVKLMSQKEQEEDYLL